MTFGELRTLWHADRKRHAEMLFRTLMRDPTYRFTCGLRAASYAQSHNVLLPISIALRLWLRRQKWRYGFDISPRSLIGGGLLLAGHPGGIVVNEFATIGKNCNLSHGVTVGRATRGPNAGVPTLADGVYVGPGAKIVGAVRVGNDVAIGANAVVTTDLPDHSVAVGVPARVISQAGARAYIDNAVA